MTAKSLFALFDSKKIYLKNKTAKWAMSVFRGVIIIGVGFMILYPLIVKFTSSIKSSADMINSSVIFLPKNPTLNGYRLLIKSVNYPLSLLRTVFFCSLQGILQLFSCSCVAYGISRFKFRGRSLLFAIAIITLVIPPQVILLPLYIRFRFFNVTNIFQFAGVFQGLDLINTPWPFVMLSATALGFKNGLYIYMLRQHFTNLPAVLEEAAYIDGCNPYKTFFRIILPGSIPMMVTVFLFSFVWQWNDTVYTSIFYPGLPVLSNELYGVVFSSLGSGAGIASAILESPKFFLLSVPLLVLYIFTQRFFTESIERSGIVG